MKKIGIVGKSRYIDANELVRAMTLQANRTMLGEIAPPQSSYSEMLDLVADAPTADVVEVRHGYWMQTSEPKFIEGIKRISVECSVCKIRRNIPAVEYHGYYYCPNCGAKIDGERREE